MSEALKMQLRLGDTYFDCVQVERGLLFELVLKICDL